jgi:3-deoxy-D-manno-octulosonate 8-phosphate phosphatase (KDO 8-P phosphatase)
MRVKDKRALLQELSILHNTSLEHILFMGDDMPDFEAMSIVGVAACPKDAAVDIKSIASYIALAEGGAGCAREVIEKVLKLNDHWDLEDHIRAQ